MTLRIYDEASVSSTPLSINSLFTNALIVPFDGRTGGSSEHLLYIRNSNAIYEYTSITLTAEQLEGDMDLIAGTQGFSFKFYAGSTQPTTEQWAVIQSSNTITLDDIDDTVTFLPFWVRIEVPRQVSVQMFRGVKLKITSTQVLA